MCAAMATPIIKGEYKLYHGMPVHRKKHMKEHSLSNKQTRAMSSPEIGGHHPAVASVNYHRDKSHSFSKLQMADHRKETLRRILEEKERRKLRQEENNQITPPLSPSGSIKGQNPLRKLLNRVRRSFSNDARLSALRDVQG